MRRDRGNIIMTALFIAIFLFFLSIALIWTNRQDIMLSLAMEHKMKAEAAARTGAMSVFASLKSFDTRPSSMEGELDSGATWKAELVELPEEGKRGKLSLLHCRGTSGPLSSYYTLHLLKSDLTSTTSGGVGTMLGFPTGTGGGAAAAGAQQAADPSKAKGSESGAGAGLSVKVLYGDFELKSVDLGKSVPVQSLSANEGPLFASVRETSSSLVPLAVVDYIPVLDPMGGDPMAYGPVAIRGPKPALENTLRWLNYANNEFNWEVVPDPKIEPEVVNPPPVALLDMMSPAAADWTSIATRAIGQTGTTSSWRDRQPATSSTGEMEDLAGNTGYEVNSAAMIDWGSTPSRAYQRGYSLVGAIAASGRNVYSFAWEYAYTRFSRAPAENPIPAYVGSTITRWPCIRRYNIDEKEWSTVWSALKDSGDVRTGELPDMDTLLATTAGVCYSRSRQEPYRLLRLSGEGAINVGREIPGDGKIFLYKDAPYGIISDPAKPGLQDLEGGTLIGFETLPTRIPEIFGPVVAQVEGEEISTGMSKLEISSLGAADELPAPRTVRKEYNLSYRVDPGSSVASDGKDLYTNLVVTVKEETPSYDFFGSFKLAGPPAHVLARYDGARWHILPNGLMKALDGGPTSPGTEIFSARYTGLPQAKSRYTVVSMDTDHYEFKQ